MEPIFSPLSSRFQSERESGDRNFAIGYYLKEKKVLIFFCVFQIVFLDKINEDICLLHEVYKYPQNNA